MWWLVDFVYVRNECSFDRFPSCLIQLICFSLNRCFCCCISVSHLNSLLVQTDPIILDAVSFVMNGKLDAVYTRRLLDGMLCIVMLFCLHEWMKEYTWKLVWNGKKCIEIWLLGWGSPDWDAEGSLTYDMTLYLNGSIGPWCWLRDDRDFVVDFKWFQ